MPNLIEITEFSAPELDVYARLSEVQLRSRQDPSQALFIAESPLVIGRALDAGCVPVSALMDGSHVSAAAREILARLGADVPVFTAEDAVQEAICAAYAGRGSLRDPARFRPWILKILVNKCYEFCRKRRTTVDLADIQDFLPAPAADQAERLSLWQAVMALNSDLRAVVTLFYYEDLSIREISAVLGISEAAVKTRLSRGRSRLKQLLHEE